MNTLVRNPTVTLSRKLDGYEPLDQDQTINYGCRAFSRSSKNKEFFQDQFLAGSSSIYGGYKEKRAKQRQVFLKSYKLMSVKTLRRQTRTRNLNKFPVKVKKVMVSILGLLRKSSASITTCDCSLSTRALSPVPRRKPF